MIVHGVTPILNVSNMDTSFACQGGLERVVALGRPDGIWRRWLRSVRDLYVSRRPRRTREREEHEHLR